MNAVDRLRNSPHLCYKQRMAIRKENLQCDVGTESFVSIVAPIGAFFQREQNKITGYATFELCDLYYGNCARVGEKRINFLLMKERKKKCEEIYQCQNWRLRISIYRCCKINGVLPKITNFRRAFKEKINLDGKGAMLWDELTQTWQNMQVKMSLV